jgi:hypothetical protein
MHILFLCHYFPPEVNAPATRTYEHCRRWVAAGHRVTVITSAPNCPDGVVYDGYTNRWKSTETVDGIRVIRVWTYVAPNKGFLGRICNYISYMLTATIAAVGTRDVDVVVATSPQFFCGWAGAFTSWLLRRPFILEIRDIWPESIVAVGAMKRSRMIRLLEWLERRLYRSAKQIVTVGEGYRGELRQRGVPAERITVIPNGVDLPRFSVPKNPVELKSKWNSAGKFVCGYVGTVGMAHGLEVVLDAAEQLETQQGADVVFWIVGDGADRERLQREAARRKLTSVRFTGRVTKSEIPTVLANCDACLVHLRGTDLFGTVIPSKIFEAMAMNVPIIIGVRGSAREIVLEAGAGVAMTPDDPKSLLRGVEAVRAQSEGFAGGRQFVAAHFNRDILATQMLGLVTRFSLSGTRRAESQSVKPNSSATDEHGSRRKAA